MATFVSPRGFIDGHHSSPKVIRKASCIMLAGTIGAIGLSYVMRASVLQAGAVPFVGLRFLQWSIKEYFKIR